MKSTELLQELFTREAPFHHIRGYLSVMLRLLKGPPDRPRADDTEYRLTDEWWSMCGECWNIDPSLRPAMVEVSNRIEMIVCSPLVPWLPVIYPRR